MVFSSTIFLFLFLPLLLLLNFLLPHRLRNLGLLVASLVFYAWGETFYVLLMLASITFNYLLGLLIGRSAGKRMQSLYLFAAIAGNLLTLGFFKYFGFCIENLSAFRESLGLSPLDPVSVHLPIGISFFTFQAMSYVCDVYRGDAKVQPNPVNLGLYISLFPQLIAGPILRYRQVADQIVKRTPTVELMASGIRRFTFGLAKKMLIANTVGRVADEIFAIPASDLTHSVAWLGVLAYTLQIYFDFSAYSDMAIGLGRILGFRFPENFNYPYVAQSMRDFWRRWHISLSMWFRDYLYVSLGGNRRSTSRTYFNLVIVFSLCGLWHGASWNFLVWGLLHGAFLVFERMGLEALLQKVWRPLRHAYVLLVAAVAWVFFRADDLAHATAYLGAMFGGASGDGLRYYPLMYLNTELAITLSVAFVAATPIGPRIGKHVATCMNEAQGRLRPALAGLASVVFFAFLGLVSGMYIASSTYNPFIYFRF